MLETEKLSPSVTTPGLHQRRRSHASSYEWSSLVRLSDNNSLLDFQLHNLFLMHKTKGRTRLQTTEIHFEVFFNPTLIYPSPLQT